MFKSNKENVIIDKERYCTHNRGQGAANDEGAGK